MIGKNIFSSYIVNDHVHDDLGHLVACDLVDNFNVRVDQIANSFDFSFELWIHGQINLVLNKHLIFRQLFFYCVLYVKRLK